jgi:glucose-1-phosphate thymidylyltransferase
MLAGIREVLIISTPRDLPLFQELFGAGERLGMRFAYKAQESPPGAFLGEAFIGADTCALVLGDNVFYGRGFSTTLQNAVQRVGAAGGGVIFGYYVKDPAAYGVVAFDRWVVIPGRAVETCRRL